MSNSNVTQKEIDLLLGQSREEPGVASSLLDANDPGIRKMVAESLQAPRDFLVQLSFDEDAEVREAVLKNPNTPQSTKQRLQSLMKQVPEK
jgi:hypothetical protein